MSAIEIVSPVIVIRCDRPGGCPAEFKAKSRWDLSNEWSSRRLAEDAGWQTRPPRGKGSRSAPDLCPKHKADQ